MPAITAIAGRRSSQHQDIEWTEVEHHVDDRLVWFAAQRAAGHAVVVAVAGGEVVGWAAYGEFPRRGEWPGYRLTVEHTIHVRDATGTPVWGGRCWRR